MKTIILLLWLTMPDNTTYIAPATYYESMEQCRLKVSQLQTTYTKVPVPVKYLCSPVYPEVEEK